VNQATPQQITGATGCIEDAVPLDAGAGHLLIGWPSSVAESTDGGATWTTAQIPPSTESIGTGGQTMSIALAPDGTLWAAWQQRGNPASTDDVLQGWISHRDPAGVWHTQDDPLPPGGEARIGNFAPVVVADGSDALSSSEQPGTWLNNQQISNVSLTSDPLLVLLPDGTRVVAWADPSGVSFEEVPK
jgi:hypothetical protein